MCCNSKRTAYRSVSAGAGPTPAPVSPNMANWPHVSGAPGQNPAARSASDPGRGSIPTVTLHCLQAGAMRVWGPVTRRAYDFSGPQSALAVDPRDAATLVRTGLFRRG